MLVIPVVLFVTNASPQGTYARPVLVVLDRHIDLAVALHHTWTYQAMVHDLFGMERNRLRMTAADAPTTIASTSDAATVYDLDSSRDSFWADHMTVPFPLISESIETLRTRAAACG